ncbi:MAG: site-specific integrase [Clostridia bacterium]|nr:site-specific integrase [Clostridia bacterium]
MAGSLEKRGKDSWRLIVSCGMGPDGKQVKKTKTVKAASRREAEKLLAEFVTEVQKGLYVAPSKLTFKDFAERWVRDYGEVNLAPKTLHRYKQILARAVEAMGHLKMEKIKPLHLVEFYKNLQEDGVREDGKTGALSEATILYHHRVLNKLFNDAVGWEIIPSNPASKVKPPKAKKKQAACYDEKQTAALLTALDSEPLQYKTIVILALATGLRRGELMGLEWQDVDFENGTIEVRQASQYVPGIGTFTKEPKNETSKRVIAVPRSVMALLKQYKAQQTEERLKVGDLWQGSNRLFTTWDGKPMFPDTISKWFPQFLRRHNLPHITFHGLRHTSATLLIAEGVNLKNVSRRLGHSSISTTGDIYAHALRSADQEAAAKLDKLFTANRNVGRN